MFRAKFEVQSVHLLKGSDLVTMVAVSGDPGATEDNNFAEEMPCGTVQLNVDNPEFRGLVKPGDVFFTVFERVDGATTEDHPAIDPESGIYTVPENALETSAARKGPRLAWSDVP